MTFAAKPERRRPPVQPLPRSALARIPPIGLLRVAILAVAAIAASGWAIVRYFRHTPAPMFVPVRPSTAPAPTYDADAGEWPVPDFMLEPDAS